MYVLHTLETPEPTRIPSPFRWNVKTPEADKMKEAYEARVTNLPPNGTRKQVDVQEYPDVLERTCAESVAEMKPPQRPTTVGTAG